MGIIAINAQKAFGVRAASGITLLAVRGQLTQKTDPDALRFLRIVFEAVVPLGMIDADGEHGVAGERQPFAPDARRTTPWPGVWPPVRRTVTPGATSRSVSNGSSWLR